MNDSKTLRMAVIGAGPVGLALALHAARSLPGAQITVFDARAVDEDVSADPRTLALSLGSVQLLQRLGAWAADAAQPILEVHVSQQPSDVLPGLQSLGGPFADRLAAPEVRIRAVDEAVPMLGAVLDYGQVLAPLRQAWLDAAAAEPARLSGRFGTPVAAVKDIDRHAVEVDAGIAETFDLAVIAEGGVFVEQAQKAISRSYGQTAWIGRVILDPNSPPGVAYERFTRHGPAALLPLRSAPGAPRQAALVWCVPTDDDPVRELDDMQRVAVLNTLFPAAVSRLQGIGPLKSFELGLNAERTLARGRRVMIGNAAQTLHPVAGQGLNLGLRDAFEVVQTLRHPGEDLSAALRRVDWSRAFDRWSIIATTDFLARSFTWSLPGLGAARGLGLVALQTLAPLRSALARRMMFGSR
jgi:2-octaprenyl-6-methoxyphenol hydroxylase